MLESQLSAIDLRHLKLIGRAWVCSSYRDDPAIMRYSALGLVSSDSKRIFLTEAGKRACRTTAPRVVVRSMLAPATVSYHPI